MPLAVVRLASWFRARKIKNGDAEDDQCAMRSLEKIDDDIADIWDPAL